MFKNTVYLKITSLLSNIFLLYKKFAVTIHLIFFGFFFQSILFQTVIFTFEFLTHSPLFFTEVIQQNFKDWKIEEMSSYCKNISNKRCVITLEVDRTNLPDKIGKFQVIKKEFTDNLPNDQVYNALPKKVFKHSVNYSVVLTSVVVGTYCIIRVFGG